MLTVADITPSTPYSGEVGMSTELERVLNLPWRQPLPVDVEELSEALGSDGSMVFRPIQAEGLVQCYENYGCFANVPVSGGKTLMSYIASRVMGAKRPAILVRAKLRDKTKRDFEKLAKVWGEEKPIFDRLDEAIVTYWDLSNRVGILDEMQPDLLVGDEVHRLKKRNAACTQRFLWWRQRHLEIPLFLMSGTVASRSLMDFHHLLEAVLGGRRMPLPVTGMETSRWARAVDEKVEVRCHPGALRVFLPATIQPKQATVADYRRAVGNRIFSSPGLVRQLNVDVPASITLELLRPRLPQAARALMLETQRTKEDLNGDPLTPAAMWRELKTQAMGFTHKWVQPGPEEWMKRRRAWFKQAREICELQIPNLDTERKAAEAVMRGEFPRKRLQQWEEIKGSFKPQTVAVWHTDAIVDDIIKRARGKDIWIWVKFPRLAKRITDKTGWPYYRNNGYHKKTFVEDHPGGPALVSIDSCGEGVNLQFFHQNIITYVDPMGEVWEQVMGRTHRTGQTADDVSFLAYVQYQGDDFSQAMADARFQHELSEQSRKLLMADIIE